MALYEENFGDECCGVPRVARTFTVSVDPNHGKSLAAIVAGTNYPAPMESCAVTLPVVEPEQRCPRTGLPRVG